MVNENDLRTIIAQVLSEMNLDQKAETKEADSAGCAACSSEPVIEEGCLPDLSEVDIRKQYLVENPVNGEAYYDLKQYAPCRLGIGKAGARYKTDPAVPCSSRCSTGCCILRCGPGFHRQDGTVFRTDPVRQQRYLSDQTGSWTQTERRGCADY